MKVIFFALLCVTASLAFIDLRSSHSEAPGTAKIPGADITDLYAFRSYETGKENYVVFLVNTIPLQNPNAGPNYYSPSDRHFFEVNIDNDGDCVEDIIIQWYNGNSLGGNIANVTEVDDDPCGNYTIVNVTAHEGIKIPVGNPGDDPSAVHNVAVPLKFVGAINNFVDNDPVLNWREWYQMRITYGSRTSGTPETITDAATGDTQFNKPFDYAGVKSFPNYATYSTSSSFVRTIDIPGCTPSSGVAGRVFVGQRKESFSIALGKIFDLVNFVPVAPGTFPAPNDNVGVADCPEHNELAGKNVLTYALEIHQECINNGGNASVIGVWSTTRNLIHFGSDHIPGQQVSRLGNPLVNELFIGLNDKAKFTIGHPTQDGQFAEYVLYPTLPAIIDILFLDAVNGLLGADLATIAPRVPRNDLFVAFLQGVPGLNANGATCEYQRLSLDVPATPPASQSNLGVIGNDVAGFPNGRRPGDDIVDIALRVVMGKLCTLGLGCNSTDAPLGSVNFTDGSPQSVADFSNTFPFLQTPNPGSISYAGDTATVCAGSSTGTDTDGGDGNGDGNGDGCSDASVLASWMSFLTI